MSSDTTPEIKFEIGHVLFIDIVGYSKLLINEQSEQIQTLKEIVRGTEQFRIAEAEGKLLRLPTGDGGALVFRNSPEAPVLCALEISKELKKYPELHVRMGIHSGPVNEVTDLNEQANIAGAGINMAQRVMDCGDAGHILLSKRVSDDLEHYPQWRSRLHELGECEVKHGVRISVVNLYTDELGNSEVPEKFRRGEAVRADEGFWVAVLPFKYSGSNAELTALAEGLTEDIITGLSRFSYLKVISRSSTSRYADESVDIRSAGKEVGARYVMEGSLRQAGTRLRLAVQLIDSVSGAHLWAENYERAVSAETVFELQDELVPIIVSTVADQSGVLPRSMSEAVRDRDSEQLNPYEALLRSFGYARRGTAEELAAAVSALESAVRKASAYGDAWAMLALLYVQDYAQGFKVQADSLTRGLTAAQRAVEVAPSNHLAYCGLAQALFFQKEFQSFRNAAERAIALNAMDGNSIAILGELLIYAGDWERGLSLAGRAKQLNPHHPGWYWYANFYNAYRQGDYRDALNLALKVNLPGHWFSHASIAACYGQLGERDAAGKAVQDLLKVRPDFAATVRKDIEKWWEPEYVERLIDGWRKAGLSIPENDDSSDSPSRIGPITARTERAKSGPDAGPARANEGFIGAKAEPAEASVGDRSFPTSRFVWIGAIVLALVGIGWWFVHPLPRPNSTLTPRQSEAATAIPQKSIAVLPFVNISADKNDEYLSDGMTEELINVLAKVPGLRVPGRTSCFAFKGKTDEDIFRQVGEKLHVGTVLEGSVRKAGDELRVTAQLINVSDGYHLWSKDYDGDVKDILNFESSVAEQVVQALQVKLGINEARAFAKKPTENPEAHRLYLRGRYHFLRNTQEGWTNAIHYYEQALQVDPDYALAYCGLADTYAFMGGLFIPGKEAWAKEKELAQKALALDPDLADAHLSLGIALVSTFDWPGGEKEIKRALELNPNLALAYDAHAWVLTISGRFDEAVPNEKQELELDPLNPLLNTSVGYYLYLARRYDDGIAQLRRTLELDANNAVAHSVLGWCLIGKGDAAGAIAENEKAKSLDDLPIYHGCLGYDYALAGDRAKAEQVLTYLEGVAKQRHVSPEARIYVYLGLGEKSKALDWLEKSYQQQDVACWWVKVDQLYDSVRNEPRFQALLKKVGLDK